MVSSGNVFGTLFKLFSRQSTTPEMDKKVRVLLKAHEYDKPNVGGPVTTHH